MEVRELTENEVDDVSGGVRSIVFSVARWVGQSIAQGAFYDTVKSNGSSIGQAAAWAGEQHGNAILAHRAAGGSISDWKN